MFALLFEKAVRPSAHFHDLELAARFSDQLLILQNGRVAAQGPPVDVLTSELLADVFRMKADGTADVRWCRSYYVCSASAISRYLFSRCYVEYE